MQSFINLLALKQLASRANNAFDEMEFNYEKTKNIQSEQTITIKKLLNVKSLLQKQQQNIQQEINKVVQQIETIRNMNKK